ncbi:hypothetical protein GN244_ATG12618 [Phytophthora infestans]|nr:hypothetical protein GN244_ATG12618 [Phytophthora infestans]
MLTPIFTWCVQHNTNCTGIELTLSLPNDLLAYRFNVDTDQAMFACKVPSGLQEDGGSLVDKEATALLSVYGGKSR